MAEKSRGRFYITVGSLMQGFLGGDLHFRFKIVDFRLKIDPFARA